MQQGNNLETQVKKLVAAAQQGNQEAQQQVQGILQQASNIQQPQNEKEALIYQAAQIIKQILGQGQMAKLGAKLQYIKSLKNKCPNGTELVWFKKGGRLCKTCAQKHEDGGKQKKVDSKKVDPEEDQIKKWREEYRKDMKNTPDPATRDSLRANKYNDQEVLDMSDKGNIKNNRWIPDRSKYVTKKK